MTRICVLGGGQMGSALIGGLIAKGSLSAKDVAVMEPRGGVRDELVDRFPGIVVGDEAVDAEGAILAMKPVDVEAACRGLRPGSFDRLVSIAAGVTLSSLERWLWEGAHVIRSMPNTPALLGVGMSAIAGGHHVDEGDLSWAEEVLGSVGLVVRLEESALDAVTGLSGSGPAYVFYLAEALIAAGVGVGLSPEVSRELTNQTLLGAARMLNETGKTATALREAVTSPKGTTEAGIGELDRQRVFDAVVAAVATATARSKELGRASA